MNLVEQNRSNPDVSIIIPLYNKGQYVARALNSILAQTHQNFEIIVVDDGSTDNGPEIVNSYVDNRLRLIRQANAGPGAARNRGIQSSQTPLLAFLDADDEWMPNFLSELVQRLHEYPDCALAAAGHYRGAERISWEGQPEFRQLGITAGSWRLPINEASQRIKPALDFLHSGAVLARRQVIEQFDGFYAKHRCTYGEDLYLWLQVALNYKIYRQPAPLMWYHTEVSEIGIGRKTAYPVLPILSDTKPIWQNCPPEYNELLKRCLTFYAVLTARRCIQTGDRATAERFLRDYPVAQTFLGDYLQLQLRLWLMNSPGLRQRLRQVRSLVRS
jgi:glycosyltransferase involved in cell wall biosynthesis